MDQLDDRPFDIAEEELVVSLALDYPDLFVQTINFLDPTLFTQPHVQYLIKKIIDNFETHEVIIDRSVLLGQVKRELTVDNQYWQEILATITKPSNPRSVPFISDVLVDWAKKKAYGKLFSSDCQEQYFNGNYEYLEQIVESARSISKNNLECYDFHSDYRMIFDQSIMKKYTTGFPELDRHINNGGPSPKEVLLWMAPPNVGKSIMLCNNAITSLEFGCNVAFFTFEMSALKIIKRCLGVYSNIDLKQFDARKDELIAIMDNASTSHKAKFKIVHGAADEHTVDHIYKYLKEFKRQDNWKPDVICIDYLELLLSRRKSYNDDQYKRQKAVANEIRGLAHNADVLIFSATQANRSAVNSAELLEIDKTAESFGKTMPTDYIISLNQTQEQRRLGRILCGIAKNRDGVRGITIECAINYDTLKVTPEEKDLTDGDD